MGNVKSFVIKVLRYIARFFKTSLGSVYITKSFTRLRWVNKYVALCILGCDWGVGHWPWGLDKHVDLWGFLDWCEKLDKLDLVKIDIEKFKKQVEVLLQEKKRLLNLLNNVIHERDALESVLEPELASRLKPVEPKQNDVNYYSIGLCAVAVIIGFGLCCFLGGGTSSVVSPLIKTFSKTGD